MRTYNLRIPVVNTSPAPPTRCPFCGGGFFKALQVCPKPLRDLEYEEVEAMRYRCLRCRRTFRACPAGVSRAHHSDALRAVSVVLYLLGIGYGVVAFFLALLGSTLKKPIG